MLKPLGSTAIFTLAASVAFLFLVVPSDAQEAENILDDKYYATAHNNNNISPGSPRAARLTITARF